MEEKDKVKELKEKLEITQERKYVKLPNEEKDQIEKFSLEYIEVINDAKTERAWVDYTVKELNKNGFSNIEDVENLKIGDKAYYVNRENSIYSIVINKDIYEGLKIIGSHIDSPGLDLKPRPLVEENKLVYLKTQYYGGIKKYQWTAIPLVLEGVIVLQSGEKINVSIGKGKEDPIFTITDLLPHLGKEQMQRKAAQVITGEALKVLVGSTPIVDDTAGNFKLNILNILNQKYGIIEEDLASSDLQLVPAFDARTAGLDRSMIAAYGQDDRVCTYGALKALINSKDNENKVVIFADKEEVGSDGNTGMQSETFEYFMNEVLDKLGVNKPGGINKVFNKSKMLSADVTAAYDPTYSNVYERTNDPELGKGVVISKYTGGGGKYNTSDASAEFVAEIRKIFTDNNINYQFGTLGKIDEGGGGTIAYILANKGMDVIDVGISMFSMHSPYEVISKFDMYEQYKGYKAFFEN